VKGRRGEGRRGEGKEREGREGRGKECVPPALQSYFDHCKYKTNKQTGTNNNYTFI